MSAGLTQPQQQVELSLKNIIVQIQQFKSGNFSGELIVATADRNPRFAFMFRLGRLIWVSSNADPNKYWHRHLTKFSADLPLEWIAKISNERTPLDSSGELADLLVEGTLDRNDLNNTIGNVATEVFFDLIQTSKFNGDRFFCQAVSRVDRDDTEEDSRSSVFLPLVEVEPLLKRSIQAWQEWQTGSLTTFSPNLFPVVQKPEVITSLPTESKERTILEAIDGSQTIRDLASTHQYTDVYLATTLLPLLQSGCLSLSKVAQAKAVSNDPKSGVLSKGYTIACIDDSPLVYQTLEQILKNNGYQCYGVQEPLTILPRLIKQKPDFIFLDLLMPIVNGYEVCAQIRKTPSLKDIPVVILTGKDGLVDRMRSKMVGATDFMSKPVSSESVLKMLDKYLVVRN
jgi:two-component system, chemotaxis family, response regulator PixG